MFFKSYTGIKSYQNRSYRLLEVPHTAGVSLVSRDNVLKLQTKKSNFRARVKQSSSRKPYIIKKLTYRVFGCNLSLLYFLKCSL